MNFLYSLFTSALLCTPLMVTTAIGLGAEQVYPSCELRNLEHSSKLTDGDSSTLNSYVALGSARLELPNASIATGEAVCIPVGGYALDDLASFSFAFDFDPAKLSIDSITNVHPFMIGTIINPSNGRVLFFEPNGMEVTISNGDVLFELCITGQAAGTTRDTIQFAESPHPEFSSLSSAFSVEMNSAIITINGGTSLLQSQVEHSIRCQWLSNDNLIVTHPVSRSAAVVELYALDGRRLHKEVIKPRTPTTQIPVSQLWQRTLLIVRYSQNRLSNTRLIPGPR